MLNEIGFVKPLKNCQKERLMNVLSNSDVMADLPTWYEKSSIFQLAP
jgi:hypothetical protein